VRSWFIQAGAWLQLASSGAALAQGGPPLVADDPGTPGDGRWEINLATIGSNSYRHWDVSAFDADINYGWGDDAQLKLDVPLAYAKDTGSGWKSGLGSIGVGVKWRFVDMGDEHGFSMSTYPQYLSGWSGYSRRHGLAADRPEFFLPIEAAAEVGEFAFAAEAGRTFVRREPDEWEAGLAASHACFGGQVTCLVELHHTWAPHNSQTLLNLGFRRSLNPSLALLGSVGREFGVDTPERQRLAFYLGFQIVR
jgi:hypothetical protein